MMRRFDVRRTVRLAMASGLFCVFAGCFAASAAAQAVRLPRKAVRPVPELGCLLCTLTVSATPSNVNFTLVKGGVANGSSSIVIKTTMSGVSLLGSLKLYGYFSTAASALADGRPTPDKIPSSAVFGQMTTGVPTTFTAFTQTNPLGTAGASLLLFNTSSLLSLGCLPSTASCRTDNLSLRIDLTSLPKLPAGSYSGTLTLQAQAL